MSKPLPDEKVEPYEKRLKRTETLRVYDEGGIIVVKPLSYEASCLYGRKTKWCTSAVASARNWSSHLAQNICFYIVINNNLDQEDVLYKVLAEVEYNGEIRWWDAEDTQIDKPWFVL